MTKTEEELKLEAKVTYVCIIFPGTIALDHFMFC